MKKASDILDEKFPDSQKFSRSLVIQLMEEYRDETTKLLKETYNMFINICPVEIVTSNSEVMDLMDRLDSIFFINEDDIDEKN